MIDLLLTVVLCLLVPVTMAVFIFVVYTCYNRDNKGKP